MKSELKKSQDLQEKSSKRSQDLEEKLSSLIFQLGEDRKKSQDFKDESKNSISQLRSEIVTLKSDSKNVVDRPVKTDPIFPPKAETIDDSLSKLNTYTSVVKRDLESNNSEEETQFKISPKLS